MGATDDTNAIDYVIERSWMVGSSSSEERFASLAGGGLDIFLFSTTLWVALLEA